MTTRGLVIWFSLVLAVAAFGRWDMERARIGRCRLDGTRITPVFQVDLMQSGQVLASFCSLRCASEWPDVPAGGYWRVRDEVTGEAIDAAAAIFVESAVVTVPSRQDRTHAFGSWIDAMNHASGYDGITVACPLVLPPPPDAEP